MHTTTKTTPTPLFYHHHQMQAGGGESTQDILPLVSCMPDCTGVSGLGKVPDPEDCAYYYNCMNGVAADNPTKCIPDGTEFNPDTGTCETGTTCQPLCAAGGDGCPLSCNGDVLYVAVEIGSIFGAFVRPNCATRSASVVGRAVCRDCNI